MSFFVECDKQFNTLSASIRLGMPTKNFDPDLDTAAPAGNIIYNTSDDIVYVSNGLEWEPLGPGLFGDATRVVAGVMLGETTASITKGNVALGSGTNPLAGTSNTAIGRSTLTALTIGTSNTAVGDKAAASMTTGIHNSVIGANAGNAIVTGSDNTIVGYQALSDCDGDNNTAIGSDVGVVIVGATSATLVGTDIATTVTGGGSGNTVLGNDILNNRDQIGDNNVVIGSSACSSAAPQTEVMGTNNVVIGSSVAPDFFDDTGTGGDPNIGNVVIGNNLYDGTGATFDSVVIGSDSVNGGGIIANRAVIIGYQVNGGAVGSLLTNAVFIGTQAGFNRTTGVDVLIGNKAGYNISSGGSNVGIGSLTMATGGSLITGTNNTAVGTTALNSLSGAGSFNTAVGSLAGESVSTGSDNTAIGYNAMGTVGTTITGSNNTAVGSAAMTAASTTAASNTAVGKGSLSVLTTGTTNVAVGASTGTTLTTGTGNTILGNAANVNAVGRANTIVIGNGTISNGDNTVTINCPVANTGFFSNALRNAASADTLSYNSATGEVTYTVSSRRYKVNIAPLRLPERLFSAIPAVRYNLRSSGEEDVGIIAEDMHRIWPEAVTMRPDETGRPQVESVKYHWLLMACYAKIAELEQRVRILEGR